MSTPTLALVTGASSGLGAEFARQLAARGHGLILTARRADRLEALAAALTHNYGAQVEILPADLTAETDLRALADRLHRGDVHLLVNNAGFGIGGPFAGADLAGQNDMTAVHVHAPMQLMHAALPPMIQRRAGGVINVASLAAFISLPDNANYAATKAHLMRFSRSVHLEVRGVGVTVQALCPGFVITEFHDQTERVRMERRQFPAFLWLKAERVVADSLRAFERGNALVVPGALYKAAYVLARLGIADALASRALPARSALMTPHRA